MVEIYVDGSGFNGRESRYCILIEGKKPIVKSIYQNKTSNEMEYRGLLEALEDHAKKSNIIYTDSQLILGHITKGWKQNYPHLKPLIEKCKKIIEEKKIRLIWIPREKNKAGKIFE